MSEDRCSSCLSKCKGVKLAECPFYEEDIYRGIRKALDELQESFWGNYRHVPREELPQPWGTPLVQPITFEDVEEATNIVPDTVWNTIITGTAHTYNFSTNTITWEVTPEESVEDPSVAPRSNPE